MGNCIHVREQKIKKLEKQPSELSDLAAFIEKQRNLVQGAKLKRIAQIEREIRKFNRGGFDSSEEDDQVIVDKDAYDDSASGSVNQSKHADKFGSNRHLGTSKKIPSSQQSNDISIQDGLAHHSHHQNEPVGNAHAHPKLEEEEEGLSVNSQDELKEYFGGQESKKKKILTSIINQEVRPFQNEDLKVFNNTVFQKEESDDQNVGNVFSDNDISFDQSPDMKRH